MKRENKILIEFFRFLARKQNHLQLEDAENTIQEFYTHRNNEAEKIKEEKRIQSLKKLELIVQKRKEQQIKRIEIQRRKEEQRNARIRKNEAKQRQIIQKKKPFIKHKQIKTLKEMQELIDRIRN